MGIASSTRHDRSRLFTGLSAALVGLLALTAGSACVDDQDFLIVERAVWFDDPEACLLSDSEPSPLTMTVDVSFDTRIGMGFLITNNQSPNAGSNTGIDDSEVVIETAEVNLSFSGGSVAGGSFELTLPSNSLGGGDTQAFLVQAPTEVTQSLRASMTPGQVETLEMEVTFKGRKYGQAGNSKLGEVETRTFTYPLDICVGCLVNCATCDEEFVGTCPGQTQWKSLCGFAQGSAVVHPFCELP